MRIESIRIKGFGRLVDREFSFPAGKAALVIADNEMGKSTLAAAILTALCGFSKQKRSKGTVIPKDAFKPWDGNEYAVEMDIEVGGKLLKIERDFDKDSFVVRDRATGKDISSEYSSDLAAQILHLPREDFQRIAFISGKDVQAFGSSPNLQSRLSALVDDSGDDAGAEFAITALEGAKYPQENGAPLKIETAVKRLADRIAEKQRRLNELDSSLEAAGADAERLDEARARHAELTLTLADLDDEYKLARLREVRERIASAESNSGEADALREELKGLEASAGFPAERSSQLVKAVARLDEYQQQLAEMESTARKLQEEADDIKVRLDAQEQYSAAEDEDLIRLSTCESDIKNAETMCKSAREEIEREMRALRSEGIDLEHALETQKRLDALSPTDLDFVRNYGESSARTEAEMRSAEADSARAMAGLQVIKQKRSSSTALGRMMAGAGIVWAVGCIVLMILRIIDIVPSAIAALPGVLAAAVGLVRNATAGAAGADEKAKLEREYDSAETLMKQASVKKQESEQRIGGIAGKLGFTGREEMTAAVRECERSLGRSDSLSKARAQLAQAEEMLSAARERAARRLTGFGTRCEPEDDVIEAIARAKDGVTKYLAWRERRQEIERELLAINRSASDRKRGIEEEKQIISSILSEAGVNPMLPIDEAIKEFEQAGKRYRRYREIKDALLPASAKHVTADDALQKLQQEEAELAIQAPIENGTNRSSAEVEADRLTARNELGEVTNTVRELEKRVGALVDAYRAEYPKLRNELADLEHELVKASRFGNAIGIARDVMREVVESSHRRWAAALNAQASDILPRLNPDYDDLRFDDSLDFTIRRTNDGKIIEKADVDARLSTGAKDQVYLAVRLACCRELSRAGESIPILLDDPLMAADDSRFAKGLRYLAETLPSEHQVIILSCHKGRHELLRNEEWFKEAIEVVELERSAGAAAP